MRVVDNWIYLNTFAGSPLPDISARSISKAAREQMLNGTVNKAQHSTNANQRSKRQIAKYFGIHQRTITFTRSITESIPLIFQSLGNRLQGTILVSESFFSHFPEGESLNRLQIETLPNYIAADTLEDLPSDVSALFLSAVDLVSGQRNPLENLSGKCRDRGILLILDATFLLGALNSDLMENGLADIVVAETNRWLLGPEEVCLLYFPLKRLESPVLPSTGNLGCLYRSIQLLSMYDREDMENFIHLLIEQLLAGLAETKFETISPKSRLQRSGLIVFKHPSTESDAVKSILLDYKIVSSTFNDSIVLSPHIYNTPDEINKVINVLSTID
jgi:selenocysteine lyase/cysteine desulfurase